MSQCPFLSTTQEKVQCFSDCAFFNCGESDGICPFKNLTVNKSFNSKNAFEYDMYDKNQSAFFKISDDEEYI